MSTGLIIAIIVVAIIVVALLVMLPRMKRKAELQKRERELGHRREAVATEHRETAGQLEHLRILGCEFAQGFHICAPLAARDARALLAQGTLVR